MIQPRVAHIDDRLLAALESARQRDPGVLHNGDHLAALLADLAADLPHPLRNACIAAARTNAASWLTATPPYSEEQVAAWLRSQYPELRGDSVQQVVAAFAVLSGARGAFPRTPPPTPWPTASPPPADRPTVGGGGGAVADQTGHPSLPTPVPDATVGSMVTSLPGGRSMPPVLPPQGTNPPARRPLGWLIALTVAILLIGGGAGAWFAFRGGSSGPATLPAPRGVAVRQASFSSLTVSWRPVPGASRYVVIDEAHTPRSVTVRGTSHTFPGSIQQDHSYRVRALGASGRQSALSAPAQWHGRAALAAPAGLRIVADGYGLALSWDAVPNATGYRIRDLANSSFQPPTTSATTYTVGNAIYGAHAYVVTAVAGSTTGPASDAARWTPAHTLSPAEQALAYRLSDTVAVVGSCTGESQFEASHSDVIAAVECTPVRPGRRGPAQLFANQITPGGLDAFTKTFYGTAGQTYAVGCSNSVSAAGTYETWNYNGKTMGRAYCFRTNNESNWAWTYSADDVVIQIQGPPPTTPNGLHTWWLNRGGTLLRR